MTLAGGLIIQWGYIAPYSSSGDNYIYTAKFSKTFPNTYLWGWGGYETTKSYESNYRGYVVGGSMTRSSMRISGYTTVPIHWIAIGY